MLFLVFFKQKTAYEMRISDWSSDVCSSDLADAVQPARDLISIVVARIVEFSAGVELGHDDLGRRDAFFLVDSGRDAAAVILDRDRAVGVERDQNPVAMPGERLVDRVFGNLEHPVVAARSVVGVAEVHARPLANGVEAFQNNDGFGSVLFKIGSAQLWE